MGQISQRLQEAERLGFNRAVIPGDSGLDLMQISKNIELIEAANINEAVVMALGNELQA